MSQSIDKFLNELGNALRVNLVNAKFVDNDWRVYLVDLTHWRLNVSSTTPIMIYTPLSKEAGKFEEVAQHVTSIFKEHQSPTAVLLTTLENDYIVRGIKRDFPQLLVLLEHQISKLIDNDNLEQSLKELFLAKLKLSTLSPYTPSNPATGSMFVGRETEVRRIVNHPNTCFAVWGMRQIGKTSLLKEVERRLYSSKNLDQSQVLYVDCGILYTSYDYMTEIVDRLAGSSVAQRTSHSSFGRFLRQHTKNGQKPLVFLLDEVDNMMRLDVTEGRPLQRILRSSFMGGYCRYIISGFRQAREDRYSIDSPLFNFAEDLNLGKISFSEAKKLIILPLLELGISIKDPEQFAVRIYHETAGRPHMMQMFCYILVELCSGRNPPELNEDDISVVFENQDLEKVVVNTFEENLNPIEKLIALTQIDNDEFTIKDATLALRNKIGVFPKIETVSRAFEYLVFTGTFDRVGKTERYRFAFDLLKRKLADGHDIKFFIDRAKAEGVKLDLFLSDSKY